MIFQLLVAKIIPLYIFMFIGLFATSYLKIDKQPIPKIIIYILFPIIVFNGIYQAELTLGLLSIPIIFFLISSTLCFLFYQIGKLLWQDTTKNILAFTSGTGNAGVFGLPVVFAVLGAEAYPAAVLAMIGMSIYSNTVGYYVNALGKSTYKKALKKVLTLPTIYAALLGLVFNISGFKLGSSYDSIIQSSIGAFVFLGMFTVGAAIGSHRKLNFDFKFTAISFLVKFLVWPSIIIGLINLDINYFHMFSTLTHKSLLIISLAPLAINTVIFATELDNNPSKAALTVFLSTLFALIYIPFVLSKSNLF